MTAGLDFYAGTPASVSSLLARPNAATCFQVQAQNHSGGDRYLQIFDATALPVNTSIPIYSYLVPDRNLIAISLPGFPPAIGRNFNTGIFLVWSTTLSTLTLAAVGGTIFVCGRDIK